VSDVREAAAGLDPAADVFTAKDYDKALLTPAQVFDHAIDVVETGSLTVQQKLKVLKRWEADARDLETAAGESMAGGERSRFAEVRKAIRALVEREGIDEAGEPVL
jgi:hypothetical protein